MQRPLRLTRDCHGLARRAVIYLRNARRAQTNSDLTLTITMKHTTSTIALAVLTACIGSAAAQSNSVTLYGRVDLSMRQSADTVKNREIANGSTSRLGVRGIEDLGGGLAAFFDIQHRFNADNGTQADTRFWEGRSIVGLQGSFGRTFLGRFESSVYEIVELPADPWGADTVAANATIIRGRIANNRISNSINYRYSGGGITFGAQFAEAEDNLQNGTADDRPYNVAAGYAAGPIYVAIGYENPPDADDNWLAVSGSYNMGFAKLGAFFGNGRNALDQKHQAWLLSATAPVGAGEFRVSYGQLKNKTLGIKADKQLGLGYHYALSKRTTVYADFVSERRDNIPANFEKNGYDVGIKHNF